MERLGHNEQGEGFDQPWLTVSFPTQRNGVKFDSK